MEEQFFTKDFDFKKYIHQQLLEIRDEQTRREIREAARDLLIPFYEHAEKGYHQLEQKFCIEKGTPKQTYQIVLGICKRQYIDLTDPVMKPMKLQDTEQIEISSEQITKSLHQEKPLRLFTVFLEADVLTMKELLQEKRRYQGVIKTEYGEYQGLFFLQKNMEYLQQIEEVYQVFIENAITWKTVPEMYLHKMFDVYLEKAAVPEEEEILDIKIDFQEWNSYIHYDYVPIWNLSYETRKTSAYPELCIDKINYIHTLFGEKLHQMKEYLVVNTKDMRYAYRNGMDFTIVCDEEKPVTWKLLSFGYGETVYESYENKLFHSGIDVQGKMIRTKGEIQRLTKALGMEDYLILKDIKKGRADEAEQSESYEMDAFVKDEIRLGESRNHLIFEFVPKDREFYLNRDMMSYVVSRLQWELPEYQCIGRLK